MISVEVLIIITNICLATSSSPKALEDSRACSRSIIKCMEEIHSSLTSQDLTKCVINYEVNR